MSINPMGPPATILPPTQKPATQKAAGPIPPPPDYDFLTQEYIDKGHSDNPVDVTIYNVQNVGLWVLRGLQEIIDRL